jgi:hypothetical protein
MRCSTIPRVVEIIVSALKSLNAVSRAARFDPLKGKRLLKLQIMHP